MNARHDDDRRIDGSSLAGEGEGIADEIRDTMIDFRCLIVVRQNDRVALFLRRIDCRNFRGEYGSFNVRKDPIDLRVKRCRRCRDLRCVFQGGGHRSILP